MLSNKIKSSSGATILLALLFFLMCALAGSVVLAAGTASSGRIKGLKEQEQAYYRVTSAAELLRDEINEQSLCYYVDVADDGSGPVEFFSPPPGGNLKDLLSESVKEIYDFNTKIEKKMLVEMQSTNSTKNALDIDFAYKMDECYNISITIPSSGNSNNQEYACTLEIPAVMNKTVVKFEEDDRKITRTILNVSWQGAVITKNANIDVTTTPGSG